MRPPFPVARITAKTITAPIILLLVLILFLFSSCSSLRTEFYRQEAGYLYKEGCSRYKQGLYEQAQRQFERVLALDPAYGQAYAALGNLALVRENYPGAMVQYRKAIEVDPELEPDLTPLLLLATAHAQRVPLRMAGVDLETVYPLVMKEEQTALDGLLNQPLPLELLAVDTMAISPGKLGEMREKIAETVKSDTGSVRFRLFCAYLLFYGRNADAQAMALIQAVAPMAEPEDRQVALVMLGRLLERNKRPGEAVSAWLAAVEAGLPMNEVAHHLARVYQVDMASVLPSKKPESQPPAEPMQLEGTFLILSNGRL